MAVTVGKLKDWIMGGLRWLFDTGSTHDPW